MTVGLTASALYSSPGIGRVVSSAQSFRYYYRDLKQAGASMSPIERIVFSLVLAKPKAPQNQCNVAEHRT
jgi:hypothetical protein